MTGGQEIQFAELVCHLTASELVSLSPVDQRLVSAVPVLPLGLKCNNYVKKHNNILYMKAGMSTLTAASMSRITGFSLSSEGAVNLSKAGRDLQAHQWQQNINRNLLACSCWWLTDSKNCQSPAKKENPGTILVLWCSLSLQNCSITEEKGEWKACRKQVIYRWGSPKRTKIV